MHEADVPADGTVRALVATGAGGARGGLAHVAAVTLGHILGGNVARRTLAVTRGLALARLVEAKRALVAGLCPELGRVVARAAVGAVGLAGNVDEAASGAVRAHFLLELVVKGALLAVDALMKAGIVAVLAHRTVVTRLLPLVGLRRAERALGTVVLTVLRAVPCRAVVTAGAGTVNRVEDGVMGREGAPPIVAAGKVNRGERRRKRRNVAVHEVVVDLERGQRRERGHVRR